MSFYGLSEETRRQLLASGWSEQGVDEAELRKLERELKQPASRGGVLDPSLRRSMVNRRRELQRKLGLR